MTKTKLVFLDIDGTLLPPGELRVPESALDAIRRAQANGHKVFLCTGRNLKMTSPLLEYGFDGYICSAGGYVSCDGEVLVDIPMEPRQVEGLREVFSANDVDYTLEARDGTFGCARMIERFSGRFEAKAAKLNSEAARWVKAMRSGMTVRTLDYYSGEPIYKIVYFAPNAAALDEPRRRFESEFVFCQSNLDKDPNGAINGELINRRFDKGTGIKAICAHLRRPIEDTIGFGDSDNDLQMAETVGLSICMENGTDSLKRLCDRVCPSVYDDGIAREFEALGLI